MADINTASWHQNDAANTNAPPNGWPEGQFPSTVNDCARAMMGAVRRWYDRIQPTVTSTGSGNAHVLTFAVAPASMQAGDIIWFIPGATNAAGACTLDVGDGSGAKAIKAIDGT